MTTASWLRHRRADRHPRYARCPPPDTEASTSDILYALHGVRPGTAVKATRKQLKIGKPFHLGLNFWYLAPGGRVTAVFKVRRGTTEEIGIADKRFTQTRAADRVLLRSFS